MKRRFVDLAVVAMLAGAPAHAAKWTGTARVIDGDTLEIGGTRLKLAGIDAAEPAQICSGPGSVWQGKFQRPDAWRREKETGMPGAAPKQ